MLLSPHSAPADIDTEPDQGYTSNCPTSPGSVYVTVQQASSGNEPKHFIQNGGYISVTEAKQQLNPGNGSYITISQAQNPRTIVTWNMTETLLNFKLVTNSQKWRIVEKDPMVPYSYSLCIKSNNVWFTHSVKALTCTVFWVLLKLCRKTSLHTELGTTNRTKQRSKRFCVWSVGFINKVKNIVIQTS